MEKPVINKEDIIEIGNRRPALLKACVSKVFDGKNFVEAVYLQGGGKYARTFFLWSGECWDFKKGEVDFTVPSDSAEYHRCIEKLENN